MNEPNDLMRALYARIAAGDEVQACLRQRVATLEAQRAADTALLEQARLAILMMIPGGPTIERITMRLAAQEAGNAN
jgi:hypothetical protein